MTVPSRNGPLFDQVYDILWERILAGEIHHGTRLSDLDWSKKLNVSRTPVREAMRKLQQDGVLIQLDRGGCEIRRMDAGDLRSLYRCRAVLEALAVREAVGNVTDRQAAKLTEIVEKTQSSLDNREFERAFELNTQFHSLILKLSRNVYLERLLTDLRRMILFARSSMMIAANQSENTDAYAEHLQRVQADHRLILDFVVARDAEGAAAQMQSHLFSTGDDMANLAQRLGKP
jgi:DNA-binding GntR family transcriptional regulator